MMCPDEEELSAFADGETTSTDRTLLEHHIRDCAACREVVVEMRRVDEMGRTAVIGLSLPKNKIVPCPIRESQSLPRMALAVAAIVAVLASISSWDFQTPPSPPSNHITSAVAKSVPVADMPIASESQDEFERWADSYRQRAVPLVPLEEVATYRTPEILPIGRESFRGSQNL